MDSFMLDVKFLMFFALEFTVVALVGTLVLAGLYQLVGGKMRSVINTVRERLHPEPLAVHKD